MGEKNKQPKNVVAFLPKEVVTAHQLTALLDLMDGLNPFLLTAAREFNSTETPELDGGAHAGAVSAFIKVCAKIEDILADPARWNINDQVETMAKVKEGHEAQVRFLNAQAVSVEIVQRPSFQLKPAIVAVEGHFLAVWGDFQTPGAYIAGEGATPSEALVDFDKAFKRTTDEQITLIFEAEKSLDDTPPPDDTLPPQKKKEPKKK